jgi:lipoprotein-releasing system permease protein
LRVHVNDPLASREVAARIESDTGYKSVSWQEANEDLLSTFIIRNIIMYAVVGAILLVASFGTYNIIATITHEKARDIAIMKSLGLTERTVRSIFVVEALIIGLAGAFAGFVLGYLLSRGLGAIRITNPFIDSDHLPLAYDPLHYLLAGLVALVSSVSAGYAPARKAAREHPVEIIRGAT